MMDEKLNQWYELIDAISDAVNETDESKKLIVTDGVIDEVQFRKVGVMFLLKEAVKSGLKKEEFKSYFKQEAAFDYIDLCSIAKQQAFEQIGTRPKHWKELCYWLAAYEDNNIKFSDAIEKCGGNLAKVAIVNIKKVAGLSSTNVENLNRYVSNVSYKRLLKEQIESIRPKIVMCCGTFEQAKNLFDIKFSQVLQLKCGVSYFECANAGENIIFIEFIHPSSYMIRDAMKFAFAKEVFNELSSMSITR